MGQCHIPIVPKLVFHAFTRFGPWQVTEVTALKGRKRKHLFVSGRQSILKATVMLSRTLLNMLLSPWVAALSLQAILVVVLLGKKMWQRFPAFVAYSVISFAFDVASFSMYYLHVSRQLYLNVYWLNEGAGLILGLAVVYEIFRHLFMPYPALRRLAAQVFQGAIVLLAVLGCLVAQAQPLGESNHVQAVFFVVEQATRILEVGLLLSLFLFASAFGLHWRQYAFGMALGLGVFAAVELIAVTMRVQFGVTAGSIFNMVRTVSFGTSLLIWIGYILAPELAAKPAEMPKRAQLEQWNQAVMELIYQ
jgi:hypothetical protein